MNKLIVVDCTTGLVKACLSDKSTTIPAVPADERRGASLPHCPTLASMLGCKAGCGRFGLAFFSIASTAIADHCSAPCGSVCGVHDRQDN